jgi:hypothetical protein
MTVVAALFMGAAIRPRPVFVKTSKALSTEASAGPRKEIAANEAAPAPKKVVDISGLQFNHWLLIEALTSPPWFRRGGGR